MLQQATGHLGGFGVPGVDVDRSFDGAALELVDPQHFGLTDTGTTEDSNMYAIGVLAWEVSPTLRRLDDQLLGLKGPFLRFLLGELHSPNMVGSWGSTQWSTVVSRSIQATHNYMIACEGRSRDAGRSSHLDMERLQRSLLF